MPRGILPEALLASIPVALLYFVGWAYLNRFLGRFGIDITSVDIPLTTVLIFSFRPFGTPVFYILLFCIVIIVLIVRLLVYTRMIPAFSLDGTVLVCFGFLALPLTFQSFKSLADTSANSFAESIWQDERARVKFVAWEDSPASLMADFSHCNERNWLRHIISFQDTSFVLCAAENGPSRRGAVFQVSSEGRVRASWRVTRSQEVSR